MTSKTRVIISRPLEQPFTVRVSARYRPATHIDADHIEVRTTLPRPAKVFLTGYGVSFSKDGEGEMLGSLRVNARDIASDRSPFSDGDVDSIREMADEVLALAKAAGFDQDVAA